MSDIKAKGSCLCGGVKVSVKSFNKSVGACHCGTCRKWGGGAFMAVDCGTDISFEGKENISVFNSSEWAERGFCNQCGTHLFYRLKEGQQHILPVGLLDECEDVVFDHQVFIEEKPEYYSFSNETKNMTGEELFAQYAPQD